MTIINQAYINALLSDAAYAKDLKENQTSKALWTI